MMQPSSLANAWWPNRRWLTHLTFWVVCAMLAGILVGYSGLPVPPAPLEWIKKGFIFGATCFIYPLVFLTISVGIASMGNLWSVGRVGFKALLYFEIVTTLALVMGVGVAMVVQPGVGVVPLGKVATPSLPDNSPKTNSSKTNSQNTGSQKNSSLNSSSQSANSPQAGLAIEAESRLEGSESEEVTSEGMSSNATPTSESVPAQAAPGRALESHALLSELLRTNHTLHILMLALLLGIAFNLGWAPVSWVPHLERILQWVFVALRWFMWTAPLAAFAGMALTVMAQGTDVLWALLKLMITVYATMLLFVGVLLQGLMWWSGVSLWRFLVYLRPELALVLGTSSSESALPALMSKLEKMGCSRSMVGLVVPTGYSFNLDGTTLYLSLAIVFLMQVYGVSVTWTQVLLIIGVLMVTSKGAAGVTGAGFTVLASTLQAVPIVPLDGLTLLVGIDRLMSEARSITNFIGNGVATVYLSASEGELDRSMVESVLTRSRQTESQEVS